MTTAATLSFPKLPLAGVAVLIGVTIAGVAANRALAPATTSVTIEKPLESRAGFDLWTPFEVSKWSNGHVTLFDPALDRQVDLAAFGPTNAPCLQRI